ncbi:MAG: hypothetical protein II656_02175 [Ruminococcus sp.]|nr:hypothetical protein [Ruminococcus sp.]
MKQNKKKGLYIASAITVTLLAIAPIASANATIYKSSHYRGTRHISYVQTDFKWSVDNKHRITSSSATQWEEGFFTDAGGTTRTYANTMEHDWNCKTKVSFGIGKLKYSKSYSDDVVLSNNGNCWLDD